MEFFKALVNRIRRLNRMLVFLAVLAALIFSAINIGRQRLYCKYEWSYCKAFDFQPCQPIAKAKQDIEELKKLADQYGKETP